MEIRNDTYSFSRGIFYKIYSYILNRTCYTRIVYVLLRWRFACENDAGIRKDTCGDNRRDDDDVVEPL